MLLTRPPLTPKGSFDLHVLGMPPAFVLSQDQTLKFVSQSDQHGPEGPLTDLIEFKEPLPALIQTYGYVRTCKGNDYLLPPRALKPREQAPSPTCPFI